MKALWKQWITTEKQTTAESLNNKRCDAQTCNNRIKEAKAKAGSLVEASLKYIHSSAKVWVLGRWTQILLQEQQMLLTNEPSLQILKGLS